MKKKQEQSRASHEWTCQENGCQGPWRTSKCQCLCSDLDRCKLTPVTGLIGGDQSILLWGFREPVWGPLATEKWQGLARAPLALTLSDCLPCGRCNQNVCSFLWKRWNKTKCRLKTVKKLPCKNSDSSRAFWNQDIGSKLQRVLKAVFCLSSLKLASSIRISGRTKHRTPLWGKNPSRPLGVLAFLSV